MSDFILALAVILMFAFVLFFLKKVNYFLGENRAAKSAKVSSLS